MYLITDMHLVTKFAHNGFSHYMIRPILYIKIARQKQLLAAYSTCFVFNTPLTDIVEISHNHSLANNGIC